jgi:hypothetical protein
MMGVLPVSDYLFKDIHEPGLKAEEVVVECAVCVHKTDAL